MSSSLWVVKPSHLSHAHRSPQQTRKAHPYVTRKRFPADWAVAEILKQYLRNHRHYAVKHGRMPSKKKAVDGTSANDKQHSDLPNINAGNDDKANEEEEDD